MSVKGVIDDLASLPELSSRILLDEIEARYHKGIIYTYIGDILLAVNPLKELGLYTPEIMAKYSNLTIRTHLLPHIFVISDKAYASMWRGGQNQCCIVCGESGSGKTESTKLLVQHIVQLSCKRDNDLHKKILQVSPLLEAFGNARTCMNNNSSRFGKYTELLFDYTGQVQGAVITEYLLEKSRVIQQAAGEKNFHIFYYLFAGVDPEKLKINLLETVEDHRILQPVDGSDVYENPVYLEFCKKKWLEIERILLEQGFTSESKEGILAMLTAVVHIADIKFMHDSDTDGVYIHNEELLEIASILLGVSADDLGGNLITNETTVRGERIVALKNLYQAGDGRDALAKDLYGRLFCWIVQQINANLNPKDHCSRRMTSIGILDIYGFENFRVNSFEQLCINVANEKLQFYFNQHVFKMELDEYSKEGIKAIGVHYTDNKPLVDLFIEPGGVYALLDEESKFPKASDLTLIEKLSHNLSKRSEFGRPKGQNLQFIIQHYAGPVTYSVYGFLEKNRNTFGRNLLSCMEKSESQFVADLFSATISATGAFDAHSICRRKPNGNGNRNRKSIILDKPMSMKDKRQSTTKQMLLSSKKSKTLPKEELNYATIKTLSGYFKNSLADLVENKLKAEPHFIRCIRPNASKQANAFDVELVAKQLSYTGVLETVAIRRQGYSVRLIFQSFLDRYKFIVFPLVSNVEAGPNNCSRILQTAGILKNYEIGKTKVFLKYFQVEQLDVALTKVTLQVITCQKHFRRYLARKKYVSHFQDVSSYYRREEDSFVTTIHRVTDRTFHHLQQFQAEDLKRFQATQPRRTEATPARPMRALPLVRPPLPPDIPVAAATQGDINSQIYSPADLYSPGLPPRATSVHYNDVIESILEEAMSSLCQIKCEYWGKVHYMERDQIVAKFYILSPQILVNNSNTQYNGKIFGLGHHSESNQNPRDRTYEIIQQIGEGVKISRDAYGNMYATRLGNGEIIAKGYRDSSNNCLSNEIVAMHGRIGLDPVKIFDMHRFKLHLANELCKPVMNVRRIEMLSLVNISFGSAQTVNTTNDLCWLNIINFTALDLLGNRQVLSELISLAHINLSRDDERHLQDTWMRMQRRRPTIG